MMNHNEEKAFIEKVFKKYNGVINTNNIAVLGEINYIDPDKESCRDLPNIINIDIPPINKAAHSDMDKRFMLFTEVIINLYLADANVLYYFIKVGVETGCIGNIAKYMAFKYVDEHRGEIAKDFHIDFSDETIDKRMQIGTYGYSLYNEYVRTTLDSHTILLFLSYEQLESDDLLNLIGTFADPKSRVSLIIKEKGSKEEIIRIKDGSAELSIPSVSEYYNRYVSYRDFYTTVKLNTHDMPSIDFVIEFDEDEEN